MEANTTSKARSTSLERRARCNARASSSLSYGDRETDDLDVGISSTDLSDKILSGLKLATTITKTVTHRWPRPRTLPSGGLEHRCGSAASARNSRRGKETLISTTANCTRVRDGRWNALPALYR